MNEIKREWDIQVIKDLLDQSNRTRIAGRSTIMARAFLELAKENKNHPIIVFDHYPNKIATQSLISTKLLPLMDEANKTELKEGHRTIYVFNHGDNTIIYTDRPEQFRYEFRGK